MEILFTYFALAILGLCLGSFSGASVWRLRAHQLAQDKADGEQIDAKEYKNLRQLTKTTLFNDHSRCLNCSYQLKWYDMIPLFSWLSLGGKCRKCRHPIGYLEPLIEIGVAAFFVLSYALWPYPLTNGFEIARLVIWLVAGVPLAILFTYDAKWSLLDRRINYALTAAGAINAALLIYSATDRVGTVYNIFGSVLILGGLYFALNKLSRGKWVGDGDPALALGLALLLADWKLAFIALFAANLVGCLVVIPGMVIGKLKRDSRVPFGPLLIIGFVIAALAGNYLINLYFYSLL